MILSYLNWRRVYEAAGSAVLQQYLSSKPGLIPIYQSIEQQLNDQFKAEHFNKEIEYSGGLKELSPNGGLNPDTVAKFNKMQAAVPALTIRSDSFRSWARQAEIFVEMAKRHKGGISAGLRQAALPGFSQHHTGRALDVKGFPALAMPQLKAFYQKYGFDLPYSTDTGFRMAEPWHIIDSSGAVPIV